MLISCCTYSIVGLHLLLLTHIAHSFVLLTANVDDVKKIARKFVSDSLAEKIANFIARATETIAQSKKSSEENESSTDSQESSKVSAENRMYSVERYDFDSQAADVKSKEEILLGNVPKNTSVAKKSHGFENPISTPKLRKKPKPRHERSRYIVQTEKPSLATETELSKIREEESIQLLQNNLLSSPEGKTKNKKQKKKMRPYKLLSGSETVEHDAENDDILENKGTRDDESFFNLRAVENENLISLPTEETATGIEQHIIENKKQPAKAATDVAQHETKENAEMVDLTEEDELDHDENKITQSTEKVATIGSRSFVAETSGKEEKWWEKELSAHNHEVNSKGKTWF